MWAQVCLRVLQQGDDCIHRSVMVMIVSTDIQLESAQSIPWGLEPLDYTDSVQH